MSKLILTKEEHAAGLERFKRACVQTFNLQYQWPRASDEQKAQAQVEYDAAFAAIENADIIGVDVFPANEPGNAKPE